VLLEIYKTIFFLPTLENVVDLGHYIIIIIIIIKRLAQFFYTTKENTFEF